MTKTRVIMNSETKTNLKFVNDKFLVSKTVIRWNQWYTCVESFKLSLKITPSNNVQFF